MVKFYPKYLNVRLFLFMYRRVKSIDWYNELRAGEYILYISIFPNVFILN